MTALLLAVSCKKGDDPQAIIVEPPTPVTSITLNKTTLSLYPGDTFPLTATVLPDDASEKTVTWTTSNRYVADVINDEVRAIAVGSAIITASAGGQKAQCDVKVVPLAAVDMGIVMTRTDGTTYKLYWASSNLCEDGLCPNPEDYGDYYAWGETVPHYAKGHSRDNPCSTWRTIEGKTMTGYNWASYKWCGGSSSTLTKYNTKESCGVVDNITELQRGEKPGETVDDAARAKLGGKWRIPTDAEWSELMAKHTSWTTQNGVKGLLVTGSTGKKIFLPGGGRRDGTGLLNIGSEESSSEGYYWSSSLSSVPECALGEHISPIEVHKLMYNRYYGYSIRPVYED